MHARQAAALYDPERHGPVAWRYAHDIGVAALGQLSIALWHRGLPEQSADRAREALSLAARLNQHNTQGYAQFYAGVLPAYNRRDFVALGDAAEKLIAIGHKHGMPQWAAWGTCFRGPALAAIRRDPLGPIEGGWVETGALRESRSGELRTLGETVNSSPDLRVGQHGGGSRRRRHRSDFTPVSRN